MTTHIVEPGDWLGAIAARYGFDHWSRIWDHPVNDDLRELRGSPDLVMVGDEVQIPEPDGPRGVEVAAGNRAIFTVRGAIDSLRLRVGGLGPFIATFGPVEFVLEVGSQVLEGVIDEDDQELCIPLEPAARKAKLTLMAADVYELDIGGLGPVNEDEGAHARLVNLGFRGDLEPGGDAGSDDDDGKVIEPRAQAVVAFQGRHGLERTGELDDATRAMLKALYER
jgi:hypothetical protein